MKLRKRLEKTINLTKVNYKSTTLTWKRAKADNNGREYTVDLGFNKRGKLVRLQIFDYTISDLISDWWAAKTEANKKAEKGFLKVLLKPSRKTKNQMVHWRRWSKFKKA